MPVQDFYYTIEKSASAEFKDRGSKFIGYAFPVKNAGEFKLKLNEIKKEHPKATHHCFAYRLGMDGNNFRVSDDSEPSGTAGRPILGQIDSKGLTDVLVIVVRYFGGTLLGVPGLINAYKSVTALLFQLVPIVQKNREIEYLVQFDYLQMNDVMSIIKKYNCTVHEQQLQLFCQVRISIPLNKQDEILNRLKEIINVEAKKEASG